jgi:hypothetical protein
MDGLDEQETSINVLLILFGAYGEIMLFGFAPSEGPKCDGKLSTVF